MKSIQHLISKTDFDFLKPFIERESDIYFTRSADSKKVFESKPTCGLSVCKDGWRNDSFQS